MQTFIFPKIDDSLEAQFVWFKRDLRTFDHAALYDACKNKLRLTLGVFIIEPQWIQSPEFDSCHYQFIYESLQVLSEQLKKMNIPLFIFHADALFVWEKLYQHFNFSNIYSHEENGLGWSYKRDREVATWCKSKNIKWIQHRQFGVTRGLKNRDHWAEKCKEILLRPLYPEPSIRPLTKELETLINLTPVPTLESLNLPPNQKIYAQKGGRKEALFTLNSFLNERGKNYFQSLSSPLLSQNGNSRLSPYLTYGNLSLSEVHLAISKKLNSVEKTIHEKDWKWNLRTFENRLWWHCHFIQKLESEPQIEFQNMNSSYNGLRENEFNEDYFKAWCEGKTGFPMIDACMRSLHVNGWINFRMRALLFSFASYQLWLHWKKPAEFLAKQFVDFEPGIHYSQCQMQSGVTGINTIRIYSPLKQSIDQDPKGTFIKHYCPELKSLSVPDLFEPDKAPPMMNLFDGFKLGVDYPHPIVDPEQAYQTAKERAFSWLNKPETQKMARIVYQKHGSRKSRHFKEQ